MNQEQTLQTSAQQEDSNKSIESSVSPLSQNKLLREQIASINQQLESLQNENQQLKCLIKKAENSDGQNKQISAENLIQIQNKLSLSQSELFEVKIQNSLLKEEKQTLESIINNQKTQLDNISQQRADLENIFKKCQFENEQLISKQNQLLNEIKLKEQQFIQFKSEVASQNDQANMLQQQNEMQVQQINVLITQKQQLSEQLHKGINKKSQDSGLFKIENDQFRAKIVELEGENEDFTQKIAQLSEENEQLKSSLNAKKFSDFTSQNQESLLKTMHELDLKNQQLLNDINMVKAKLKLKDEELQQYQSSRRVKLAYSINKQQKSVESQSQGQEKFQSLGGFSDTRDENAEIKNEHQKLLKLINEKNIQLSKCQEKLKQMNQYQIENDVLKKDISQKEREIQNLRNLFTQSDIQDENAEEVQKLHNYIKELQEQVKEKDQQLSEQLSLVQNVVKEELEDELFQIRSEQEMTKQQYENQIDELYQHLQQCQQKCDALEEEKQQLIDEFNNQMRQLNLSKNQVIQFPEGEQWKERVVKFELKRENELSDMRQQLETLKKSCIHFPEEIEINAERQVYEATILQLNSRIQQLESEEQQQIPLEVGEILESNEMMRQELINTNGEIMSLKNDKQYLEIKLNQQGKMIEALQQTLSETQQLVDQKKRQKEDLFGFGSNRRDPIFNSPQNIRYSYDRRHYTRPTPNSNLFGTPFNNQQGYQNRDNFQRYATSQVYTTRNYYDMNNEIVQQKQEISLKLNEIDDVKKKYQRALNNIQKLEVQVMEKLKPEEIVIE